MSTIAAMTLDQLKRSRTTRHTNVKDLFTTIHLAINNRDQIAVEDGLNKLLAKETVLHEVYGNLELKSDPADLEAETALNETFADEIIDVKGKCNRFLASLVPPATIATFPTSVSQPAKVAIKLPKLQIKRFDGSIGDWERFLDQFVAAVHNNPALSNVDKFNYLRGFLNDAASLTIQGLTLTDANYVIAFDLLKEKYGKTEVLIDEHVRKLLATRKIAKTENGQELRKMYEEFRMHVTSLRALGKNVDAMGTLLCRVLLQAIPSSLLIEWNRLTRGKSSDDLTQVMEFLQLEIEGIEQAWRTSNATSDISKINPRKERETEATATSLLTTSSQPQKQSRACLFCDSKEHFTISCTVVPTFQGRITALQKARRCFRCLKSQHTAKQCKKTVVCRFCEGLHHTLMCKKQLKGDHAPRTENSNSTRKTEETIPKSVEATKTLVASSTTGSSSNNQNRVSVLQTIRVWVKHETGMEQVVLLFDGGSEQSFVSERLVQKLNLPQLKEEPLTIYSFGGKQEKTKSHRIPLTLVGLTGGELTISALQIKEICTGVTLWENAQIENFLNSKAKYNWKQIMGRGESVTVDILIGTDWYWRCFTGHMKRINTYMMATESIFGWMLQGSASTSKPYTHAVSLFVKAEEVDSSSLDQSLKLLWELDKDGTMAREETNVMTMEDVEVLENFKQTTTYINGRYQVEIPWNQKQCQLSNNFFLAKERLRRLLLQLQKNPVLLSRYQQGIDEYLSNGHIEEVSLEHCEGLNEFYMPHHAIVKDDRKTTKLRIVFDASSHEEGQLSLNQCHYTGPSLNPNILDLLIRFRWHQVAVTSDVAKAFLQIELKTHERDATRFLWTNQAWKKQEIPQLKVYRMTRVLFGMKASPFLLAATIRFHTSTHPDATPQVRQTIDNNTYVDDMLAGASTYKAAHHLAQEIRILMQKAGMVLTKWATNDPQLRQQWIEDGLIAIDEPIELLKVLGLMWDPSSDQLSFKTAPILKAAENSPSTKRGILEIIARLYDPLGFLSPKTISAKCLIQNVWRSKLEWDQPIPESLEIEWTQWKEDLVHLTHIQVPRKYFSTDNSQPYALQLHLFCDASPKAYGSVAYLRITSSQGTTVCLVAAKARVSPLQLISIPRLELLACLVGIRLANNIVSALELSDTSSEGNDQLRFPKDEKLSTFIWSDSKVALQWIREPPGRWKIFVGRRVQEIQSTKLHVKWNYCSSKANIADILTRGQSLKQLLVNKQWWQGPEWLEKTTEFWPKEEFLPNEDTLQQVFEEEEKIKNVIQLLTTVQPLFAFYSFSSWQHLIRITGWILRFLNQCRKNKIHSTPYLQHQELLVAELFWLKIAQNELFAEEIEALENKLPISSCSTLLCLQPYLDDKQLLRLGGRLKAAALSVTQQHPIILKDHYLVELFILDCHIQTLHGGVQATLTKVRKIAWILRGRQTVRKTLQKCMICRKWNAKPATVIEGPLPASRITTSNPFHTTGVDFAGPVYIKEGKSQVKGYICIFTCAVIRAVHLELVSSQGIKPFILALRRFIARRGAVQIFYSDNSQTFKQANRLLQDSWRLCEHEETQNLVAAKRIEWRFSPPLAPWWGGFFERLIGTVKQHLRRTLGNALLTAEEFATILAEVEAVINCRPLAKTTEDPDDAEYLTPSHFLLGRADGALTDIVPGIASAPVRPMLLRRWQYRKRLMTKFWKQWSNEYLLQLQSAHKLHVPKKEFPVNLGDIVLIKENRLPRGKWKMARVTELSEGRDGKVRSVMLKTTNGKCLRRAIQHLYPLEIM